MKPGLHRLKDWVGTLLMLGLVLAAAAAAAPGGANSTAQVAVDAQPDASVSGRRDELRLKNGDVLFGKLHTIEPVTGVAWTHPDSDGPIAFNGPSVAEIFLGQRLDSPPGTNSCRILLTNHDQLEGDLISCDTNRVVLDTPYAGRIQIPRNRIDVLIPLDARRKQIFEGPTGIDGWTLGKVSGVITDSGQWSYKDGAFHASKAAAIARDVKLPDVSSIQFDLTWKGMFYVAIALYTDYLQPVNLASKDQEPDFGGFYSLQLNTYSANLLAVKKADPIKYLGQIAVSLFNQKSTAHVEIRSSRAKKTIALLVDGTLVKQWADNEDFAGRGTGIRFVHQGQGAIKLSRLSVSEWDGQFEEPRSHAADSKEDLAKLRNGDRVLGRIEKIQDAQMLVTTGPSGTKLTVPLNRVKQVEFAGASSEVAPSRQTDTRAWFRRGGSLTFQLERWGTNGVELASPNFGKITCSPSIFERVVFGPKAFQP